MSKPRLRVALSVFPGSEGEAQAIRSVLEWFDVRVITFRIGRGNDLVAILSGRDIYPDTDHLLLSCHGREGRIVMPEIGAEVSERGEPVGDWTAEDVRRHARLPGLLVLSTGCSLGCSEMVRAFLDSGCRGYIGTEDYPQGDAALFFVLRFYYELLTGKCSESGAVELARLQDDQTRMYRLHAAAP